MVENRINQDGDRIAGVDVHMISSLHRIFHTVFLQDFRGSHRSRISEYIARLFFVVGATIRSYPSALFWRRAPKRV